MLVRRWFFTVVVMVALLSAGSVPAEVPVPIKDLYTLTDGGSVWLGAALGGYLYYGGCYQEDFYGCELVRTPIGGSGVERVKDIQPGPDGSNPDHFMTVGGLVFFRANGNQLWKTDGTEAGTQRVRSFSSLSDPRQDAFRWAAVGNTLFFRAQDNFGMELWMTDGTTSSRIDLCGGSCSGDPRWLTTLGSSVIFSGSNGSDVELWRHQGGITTRYADINPSGSSFPDHIESLGGVAVFQAQDATEQGLFSTDGATVSKIAGSATFFYGFTDLKVAGGIAFFDGNDGGVLSGRELWISNGTQAGTALIKDIRPGSFSSDPQDFAAVGNLMYFTANDGTNGRELWVSNGNGAGTLPLEIVPGSGSPSFQYDIVDLNGGQAFFVADNGSGTGSAPWVSNGTPAGTILLGDFVPGSSGLVSGQPMTTSGFAFFHGSASGSELWRSNGTTAGTVPLTQLSTNSGGGAPNQIVSYGGYGYFCTDDGIYGKELWRTDGTTAGTFLLQDLNPGYRSGCDGNIVSSGGSLYIPGINGTDFGLWRSNGQPGGTVWVKTFNAAPQQLVAYNGIVCFVADDGGGAGAELWCSNGTTGGTYLVKDVYPGSLPATITDLTAVGGQLYFGGRFNSTGDFELWKSNGTEMGTVVVRDIQPGSAGSFPGNFGAVGSTVLFTATTSADGTEVWKTDGTVGGTVMVKDINTSGSGANGAEGFYQLGGYAYFVGDDGSSGRELWRTDGTTGNTTRVADIRPGSSASSPRNFALINGTHLLFSADDGSAGREPWITDGSSTTQLLDINPSGSSDPVNFFATGVGNQIYFRAAAEGYAAGLWTSDLTPGGTMAVSLLHPEGGNPSNFAFAGSKIVFTASAGVTGTELWSFGQADCGDAPGAGYKTLLADGAACHRTDEVVGPRLGSLIDADDDGQPTPSADGDDLDGTDDEDGVVFTSPIQPDKLATFDVTLSSTGFLNAWFDWDADGDWDEFEDHVIFNAQLGAGTHTLSTLVPDWVTVGPTAVRFRVDSHGTPLTGGTLFDGEVEDYAVEITVDTADLAVTMSAPPAVDPGGTFQATVTTSNASGPDAASGIDLIVDLNSPFTPCSWTCTGSGGASCSATGVYGNSYAIEDVVDLPVGGSTTHVLTCAVASDADGDEFSYAYLELPAHVVDPDENNNEAEALTSIQATADLSISVTDGVDGIVSPGVLNYTIEVQNPGPSDVFDLRIRDEFPPQLSNVSWSCGAIRGGVGCPGSSTGNIDEYLNLPAGTSVVFTVTADATGTPGELIVNAPYLTLPMDFSDPDTGNNTATDVTEFAIAMDGFDSGDFSEWSSVVGNVE
jgi:uncharacterized repeat protein (TIGR01451 family)